MILYITIAELKGLTNLQNNVDEYRITGALRFAQETRVDELIGADLAAELQTQLGAVTVTVLNQALIDNYLKQALAWWTVVEGYYDLHYSLTNKGIVTKNSDPQSATVSNTQLESYRQYLKDRAEYYSTKLTTFLYNNKTDYPLYGSKCGYSKGSSNFGIYIPPDNDYNYKDNIRRFLD